MSIIWYVEYYLFRFLDKYPAIMCRLWQNCHNFEVSIFKSNSFECYAHLKNNILLPWSNRLSVVNLTLIWVVPTVILPNPQSLSWFPGLWLSAVEELHAENYMLYVENPLTLSSWCSWLQHTSLYVHHIIDTLVTSGSLEVRLLSQCYLVCMEFIIDSVFSSFTHNLINLGFPLSLFLHFSLFLYHHYQQKK